MHPLPSIYCVAVGAKTIYIYIVLLQTVKAKMLATSNNNLFILAFGITQAHNGETFHSNSTFINMTLHTYTYIDSMAHHTTVH
jgi:hypothetical protein